MGNQLTNAMSDEVAALVGLPASRGVRASNGFVLGSVDREVGVQPADVLLTVEIDVASTEDTARLRLLVGRAFNVLGERSVPAGHALACAIPPYLASSDTRSTFTILLRRRRDASQAAVYDHVEEG